jgi:hypothetical protein
MLSSFGLGISARYGQTFVNVLKIIDPKQILPAVQELVTFREVPWNPHDRDAVISKISAGLSLLRVWSTVTRTDVDDVIVAQLERISTTTGMLDVVADIVIRIYSGGYSLMVGAGEEFGAYGLADYLELREAKLIAESGMDFEALADTIQDLCSLICDV